MIKQYYLYKFNLSWVICFHSLNDTIIWLLDRNLSGATTPG